MIFLLAFPPRRIGLFVASPQPLDAACGLFTAIPNAMVRQPMYVKKLFVALI